MTRGFDPEKYLEEQTEHILERIRCGECERLYLEFGGKIIHDKHAARVLPGFDEDAKIKLLQRMKDKAEVIICVYAGDILTQKTRQDFGITYDMEVLRLIDMFRKYELEVNSVVITRYEDQPTVNTFITKLERRGIKTYKHRFTKGYPTDVDTIVSEEGYGANPYIEVSKPIIILNGPGPGSGKLATCLSQLYHEYLRGIYCRYAKFETFPIWNLPLKHPVNIAYEAATVDLKDVNMIDNFHLEHYGVSAVNYNRDIEMFPVLKRIVEKITGKPCEYNSPTDMGVNRAGFCITDDEVCREAACQEIIRRYLIARVEYKKGIIAQEELDRSKLLMDEVGVTEEDRSVVRHAREYAEYKRSLSKRYENLIAMAMELPDGTIITGRSSRRMVAGAALILNAIKHLCGYPDEVLLISPEILSSIQHLKINILEKEKSTLTIEEVLSALTISTAVNPMAAAALEKLRDLAGCRAHCTAILSDSDNQIFHDLKIDATSDPEFSSNSLYLG